MSDSIDIRDGTYGDVRTVYDSLTDEERNFVTPGRSVYKDIRPTARSIAYMGRKPVGFADVYGDKDGELRPSPNVILAISGNARGHGLARRVVHDAIAKVEAINAAARKKRLRRFVWSLLTENHASAAAAVRSGFTEATPKNAKTYRRFVREASPALEKTALSGSGNYDVTGLTRLSSVVGRLLKSRFGYTVA